MGSLSPELVPPPVQSGSARRTVLAGATGSTHVYTMEPLHEVSRRFDDIARRMREIAYCLDVRDEVAEGRWTPTTPEDCRAIRRAASRKI